MTSLTRHFGMGVSQWAAENRAFPDHHNEKDHVYVRFGDWPEDERSTNWAMGHKEDGVSVYELDKHGNPIDPDGNMDRDIHRHADWGCERDEHGEYECGKKDGEWDPDGERGNETDAEMRDRVHKAERVFANGVWDAKNARGHLVKGDLVSFGHDDEPLLQNVRRVGDWIAHRHHFIPTAEPHPLLQHHSEEDEAERKEYHEADFGPEEVPHLQAHAKTASQVQRPSVLSGDQVGELFMEPMDHRVRDDVAERWLREDDSNSDHRGWDHLDRLEREVLAHGSIREPVVLERNGDKTRVMDGQHRALISHRHGLPLPVVWHEPKTAAYNPVKRLQHRDEMRAHLEQHHPEILAAHADTDPGLLDAVHRAAHQDEGRGLGKGQEPNLLADLGHDHHPLIDPTLPKFKRLSSKDELPAEWRDHIESFKPKATEKDWDLSTPEGATNNCGDAAEEFQVHCGDRGASAWIMEYDHLKNHPPRRPNNESSCSAYGHAVNYLADSGHIIDWTARQFDPKADFPHVEHIESYRKRWHHSDHDEELSRAKDCPECREHFGTVLGSHHTAIGAFDHQDWSEIYDDVPDEVHRGVGVNLPDDLHRYVHDDSQPVHERAKALLRHLTTHEARQAPDAPNHHPWTDYRSGLGTSWSSDQDVSERFAEENADRHSSRNQSRAEADKDETWGHYMEPHPDGDYPVHVGKPGTAVVLHAHKPELHEIDDDLNGDGSGTRYTYHGHGEQEVPVHGGTSIRIKGISWRPVLPMEHPDYVTDPETYTRHDFDEPQHHEAVRAGTDPLDYSQCTSYRDTPTLCNWHKTEHLETDGEPRPDVNGHGHPHQISTDVPQCDLCTGFHDTLHHYSEIEASSPHHEDHSALHGLPLPSEDPEYAEERRVRSQEPTAFKDTDGRWYVRKHAEHDWRGMHTAPGPDNPAVHEISEHSDSLEHPEYYNSKPGPVSRYHCSIEHQSARDTWAGAMEGVEAAKAVQGKPDAPVTIYRSVPSHIDHIHSGDWVTLSGRYAQRHAESNLEEGAWKILKATVPAKHVNWDWGDAHEYGYNGPDIEHAEEHTHRHPALPYHSEDEIHREGMTQPRPTPDPVEYEHSAGNPPDDRRSIDHEILAWHPDHPHPIGLLNWRSYPGSDDHRIGEVQVHPDYRRQGIAAEMLRRAEEIAGKRLMHSDDRSNQGDAWAHAMDPDVHERTDGHDEEEYYTPDTRTRLANLSILSALGGTLVLDGSTTSADPGRLSLEGGRHGAEAHLVGGHPGGGPRLDLAGSSGRVARTLRRLLRLGSDASGDDAEAGPRGLTYHPKFEKDMKSLDKPVQKQIKDTIDSLARGDANTMAQTHPLTGPLKGWSATKASRGHRIVHKPSEDGGLFIGGVNLHEYDDLIRRLT